MMSYLPGGEGLCRVAGWQMDERTVQETLMGTQGKSHHAGKDRDMGRMEVSRVAHLRGQVKGIIKVSV